MTKQECLALYIKRNFDYMRAGWKGKTGLDKVMAVRDQVLILQQGAGPNRDRRLLFNNVGKDAFQNEIKKFFSNRGITLTPQEERAALGLLYSVGDYLTTVLLKSPDAKMQDTSEVIADDYFFNNRLTLAQQTANTNRIEKVMTNIEKKVFGIKPLTKPNGTPVTDPGGWQRCSADPNWMKPIDKQRGSELFFACAAAQQDKVSFKSVVKNVRSAALPKENYFYYNAAEKVEESPLTVAHLATPTCLNSLKTGQQTASAYSAAMDRMAMRFESSQGGGQ